MYYLLILTEVSYKLISSIEDFEKQKLDKRFRFLFPKLIHTTQWKYDYIVFERKDLSK